MAGLRAGMMGVWVCMLAGGGAALAQATSAVETAGDVARTNNLQVTPVMGFNLSTEYSAQHNSATGWANVVTPTLSYRLTGTGWWMRVCRGT